jgi:hypothetical protein
MERMKKGQGAKARRLAAAVFAAVSALMLLATSAIAAVSSAQQGYSTPGGKIQSQVEAQVQTFTDPHTHTVAAVVNHGPQLPFTGLDVVAVLIVGLALLALGFGIRRLAANSAAH